MFPPCELHDQEAGVRERKGEERGLECEIEEGSERKEVECEKCFWENNFFLHFEMNV